MTSEPQTARVRLLRSSLLALLTIVALFLAIRWFHTVQQRRFAKQNACISSLRVIDGAKIQAASVLGIKPGGTLTREQIAPYAFPIGENSPFECSSGGTIAINPLEVLPTCSVPGHTLP